MCCISQSWLCSHVDRLSRWEMLLYQQTLVEALYMLPECMLVYCAINIHFVNSFVMGRRMVLGEIVPKVLCQGDPSYIELIL
jgi:hypothetical protein